MTTVSKNVYFDVLDYIVDEYNNTYRRTIKTKPIKPVKSDSYANEKILDLKLVIMLEYQNTKTFLLKDTLQIGQKKFL